MSYFLDGQKIAKRLSSQITKETAKIKTVYNFLIQQASEMEAGCISLVMDPSSVFWNNESNETTPLSSDSILLCIKNQIIHNHLLIERSMEETILLQKEMINFLSYLHDKINIINKQANDMNIVSPLLAGAYSLAQRKVAAMNNLLLKAVSIFSYAIVIPDDVKPSLTIPQNSVADELDDEFDLDEDSCDDDDDNDDVDINELFH